MYSGKLGFELAALRIRAWVSPVWMLVLCWVINPRVRQAGMKAVISCAIQVYSKKAITKNPMIRTPNEVKI